MVFLSVNITGSCKPLQLARQSRRPSVRVLATSNPGAKVEKWLQTPFDIAAFGPRAAFGALVSVPERLQTLQADVERVTELIQDPRPIEEKQQLVLQEVEDTLVEFLERGATIETEVLAGVKAALPVDVARQLEEFIPPPPSDSSSQVYGYGGSSSSSGYGGEVVEEPPVTYTADAVLANQIASEMSEIRNAVGEVKEALEALRNNQDQSKVGMLRLNLREARDQLARRVAEAAPGVAPAGGGSDSGSLAAATREASLLLDEVDAQFFRA